MIAARQAIDQRPKLERLDALLLRSAGVDPAAPSFEFRPLWQLDAAASASIALQKAQATQIYAGLNLWPAAVTAKLVEAQLIEDGTYPGAEGIFAEAPPSASPPPPTSTPTNLATPTDGGAGAVAATQVRARRHRPPPSRARPHVRRRRTRPWRRSSGKRPDPRPWPPIQGGASQAGGVGNPYSFNARAEDPVEPDPRAAQNLDAALSDYRTRRYTIGNQTFQFDKAGMRYVLERHAPDYWDGSQGETQTFFPEGTTIEHLQDVVGDVLGQNRDAILAAPSEYQWNLYGTSGGVRYNVGMYRGRITHLVPQQ